jgi:hypothetical protein
MRHLPIRLVPTLITLVTAAVLAFAGAVTAAGTEFNLSGRGVGACATCFVDPGVRPEVPEPDWPVAP